MIFKPNDLVIVMDNIDNAYSGKQGKVIARGIKDGYEGYEVEFTTPYGFTSTEFIRSDHLIISPSKLISTQKAKWEETADAWQKKLWQDKMKKD